MLELECPRLEGRERRKGRFAAAADVQTWVRQDAVARRPDGSLLFVLLRRSVPPTAGRAMYAAVRQHITLNKQRATASGQKQIYRVKQDGTRSGYGETPILVRSDVLGYLDRSARMPYCRRAKFAPGHPEVFAACLPAIQHADGAFRQHAPTQHAAQAAAAARTHPAYLIPGSSFTTVTLNLNFRTAYHRDAGDLPEGFGVMTCYRGGLWQGAELCFAEYGVAVALDSFDLLLFDPHALHGNLPLRLLSANAERLTCVHYFRRKMVYCAEPAEELRLAAEHDKRRGGRDMRAGAWRPNPCAS